MDSSVNLYTSTINYPQHTYHEGNSELAYHSGGLLVEANPESAPQTSLPSIRLLSLGTEAAVERQAGHSEKKNSTLVRDSNSILHFLFASKTFLLSPLPVHTSKF